MKKFDCDNSTESTPSESGSKITLNNDQKNELQPCSTFGGKGDDGSASILKPGNKKLKKVAAARVPKDAANRGSRQRNPSKQPVTDDDALPSQPKEQHTVTVVHRVADDEFLEVGLGSGGTFKTRGRATPGIEPNQKKNRSQKQKRKGR